MWSRSESPALAVLSLPQGSDSPALNLQLAKGQGEILTFVAVFLHLKHPWGDPGAFATSPCLPDAWAAVGFQ